MHDRLHKLLTWVLCALLLGAGAPGQRAATCKASEPATALVGAASPAVDQGGNVPRSCCTSERTCCCKMVADACGCEQPAPAPAPAPPAQKQPLQREEAEPVTMPRCALPPPASARSPRDFAALPSGVLPRLSRQEALSNWRC